MEPLGGGGARPEPGRPDRAGPLARPTRDEHEEWPMRRVHVDGRNLSGPLDHVGTTFRSTLRILGLRPESIGRLSGPSRTA